MENVSKKERVTRALNHQETDKVPVDLGGKLSSIALTAYEDLKALLSIEEETEVLDVRLQIARISKRIMDNYDVDTMYVYQKSPKSWDPLWDGDTFIDEWGIRLKKPERGFYYDYIDAPMSGCKTLSDIESYNWPDTKDLSRNEGVFEETKALVADINPFIMTSLKGTFEQAWALRGIENYFEDLVANRTFAEALLDKVLEVQMEIYGPFFELISPHLDMVAFSDDVGGQNALLISPKMYREIIKPRHAKLVNFIKKKTNAFVAYHTCGSVYELIPDFYDAGIDVLNPIQVSAKGMDIVKIKREFGNDLSFWGAIDVQKLLPFSDKQQVIETVRETISVLNKGGGYLLGPAHNIQAKTPVENIDAMYSEAMKANS